jgi:hypothetical protein
MFLLFQHAVFEEAEMPQLIAAIDDAWARQAIAPFDYARLKDRYTEERLNYQLYGTQTTVDGNGAVIDRSDGCLEDINRRRKALGIQPRGPGVAIRTKEGRLCRSSK